MAKDKALDPVGQMLTLAARRHRVRTAALLDDLGLFPGQDKVLQALSGVEGLSMSAIAGQLNVRPPTASKMIARMAAQGLLSRKGREGDARLVMVSITDEGLSRIDGLRRVAKRVEREALAGLDDKDMRRLRRLLKKVARNLGEKEPGERDAGGEPDDSDIEIGPGAAETAAEAAALQG